MAARRSLGYESLKITIGYMCPGVRFSTVQQCPSFASIDRIVPYRINYLHIGPDAITINKTSYKLGIIQVYTNQETPERIRTRNEEGGLINDVDRYGIRVNGEIDIGSDEQQVRRFEEKIESLKKERRWKLLQNDEEVLKEIDLAKLEIVSHSLRLKNADPPYTHYIQLKIGEKVECLVYNKTLIEARDYFLRKIFGGSGRKVQVLILDVGSSRNNTNYPQCIYMNLKDYIRAPLLPLEPGKLTVYKVRIRHYLQKVSEAIRPILSDQKLKCLEIGAHNAPYDPLIDLSEQLILIGNQSIDNFTRFSNKRRIHMNQCFILNGSLKYLVKNLRLDEGLSEKFYSIGYEKNAFAVHILHTFLRELGLQRRLELKNGVLISLNEKFDLHVTYESTRIEDKEFCEHPWIVKIRIQRK